MLPILYPPGERAFTSGGIATLTDCIKATVTEERNGAFELVLQYPANGKYFGLVQEDCIVLARPNLDDPPQPFRLYKSERQMSGLTTWYGEHLVYFANDVPVEIIPSADTNPAGAFAKISAACAIPCPFTFSTDITTVAAFGLATPTPLKKVLGGMEGSIIDAFGGEYHYNGLAVELCKARGANKGFRVEYGRNLTDINQEKALTKVTTAIYPFWQGQDDNGNDVTITLPEKIVELVGVHEYGHPHCKTIDFSQDIDGVPTAQQLRATATAYLTTSGIAEPAVSITLKYAQLSSFGQNRILEQLGAAALCDTVTVYFERLGIEAEAKIIKTVFNVLKERFDEVEVGEAKSTLSSTINNNRVDPEKIVKKATTTAKLTAADLVQAAADRITAGMSGASGGYVVHRPAINPSETLYMDAPTVAEAKNIMRLNSAGISFSTNGIDGPFSGALAINGEWFTQFIATWNLTANIIKAGILQDATGKNSINLDTGEVNLDCASLKIQGQSTEQIAAVAGRNLVSNSALMGISPGTVGVLNDILTVADGVATFTSDDLSKYRSLTLPFTAINLDSLRGKTITFSCESIIVSAVQVADKTAAFVSARAWVEYTDGAITTGTVSYCGPGKSLAPTAGYTRYSTTFKILDKPIKLAQVSLAFQFATGSMKYRRPQVEIGAVSSPWAPAPEDSEIAATLGPKPAELTQQDVFNKLTNNGALQGIYMKDGKLYINGEYIATGRLASTDGISYFDLNSGVANLKGVFATEPITNAVGTYRVYLSSGKISLQRLNGSTWNDEGFIQWNVGVTPAQSWIKCARMDATESVDTPGVWVTGGGKMLGTNSGRRELTADMVNGYPVSWQYNGDMQRWVLTANA